MAFLQLSLVKNVKVIVVYLRNFGNQRNNRYYAHGFVS